MDLNMSMKIKNSKFISNGVGISIPKGTHLDVEGTEFIDNGEALKVTGGITYNVPVLKVINEDKKPWYKNWEKVGVIFGGIAAIAAIIAIFSGFSGDIKVSSYNQSGGVTAGKVVYENQSALGSSA